MMVDDTDATDDQAEMSDTFGTFNVDTTSLYYNGYLPARFNNYTILVLTDANTINVVSSPG